MRTSGATEPSKPGSTTEDWYSASSGLVVVLDGATSRTETGCVHGTAWYTHQLGAALNHLGTDAKRPLVNVIGEAIAEVAAKHPECDLSHPGTPSAAAAILRAGSTSVEHAILGDVTIVIDDAEVGARAMVDQRVDSVARTERDAADRLPIDSPEKLAVLVNMKHAELAARNTVGGYWIAAAMPEAAQHALFGSTPLARLRRAAVLTDGAARAVQPFALVDWDGLLDMLQQRGPQQLLHLVREAEWGDPRGLRWPRNKQSDDATAVFVAFD